MTDSTTKEKFTQSGVEKGASSLSASLRAKRLPNQTFIGATAIITGAASGIGRETAIALSALGANTVLVDVNMGGVGESSELCSKAALDKGFGESFSVNYLGDVSNSKALDELASKIASTHGTHQIVINNAGVGMSACFADMSSTDWEWIRGINLDGVLNGCRSFGLPMLTSGGGQVVNISSGLGYTMRATEPAYVTTKAAVLAFSRCLRADWANKGVGVSVICPGVINTPIVHSTRYIGERSLDSVRASGTKLFAKGHAPTRVAQAIISAISADSGVVTPGWEAKLGWWLNGLVPNRLETKMARYEIR